MATAQREVSGTILKGAIEWVKKRKLRDRVVPLLSPPVAELFDRPPLAIAWFPAQRIDELMIAMEKVAGTDQCVAFGLEATRETFGPVLNPIMKGLLNVFGARPQSLLARLDVISRIVYRGVTWEFSEQGPERGRLTTATVDPAPRAWYASWAGAYSYAFEISASKGRVVSWTVRPGGRAADYEFSFVPPTNVA